MSFPSPVQRAGFSTPETSSLLKLGSPDRPGPIASTASRVPGSVLRTAEKRASEQPRSSGAVDASVVHADEARRATVPRIPFLQLIVGSQSRAHQTVASWQVHFVTASPNIAISQDRCARYVAYLQGLRLDFAELDAAVKAQPLPAELPALSIIFAGRLAGIDHDIATLGGNHISAHALVRTYDHVTHLRGIADKPHLVVVHIAVHGLGLLFGGQGLAQRMPASWGEAKALYAYQGHSVRTLANQCIAELEAYQAKLPDAEYNEYAREVAMPWRFACHMLEQDLEADIKYS